VGKGRDRGPWSRAVPLGGAGGAVLGAQIARGARASFPLGIHYLASLRSKRAPWGAQVGAQVGGPGGRTRRGERRPKRADGPGVDQELASAPSCAPPSSARSSRWGRELSSPLFRMQRPCRGVRYEHKVNAAFSPEGTCERGAAAWERLLCGTAFPDGVARACARQGARARDGADEKIVALGAELGERTGTCQREHGSGRRSCAQPRASACKDQDAVTVALTAALRASDQGDGAGARAVAT